MMMLTPGFITNRQLTNHPTGNIEMNIANLFLHLITSAVVPLVLLEMNSHLRLRLEQETQG